MAFDPAGWARLWRGARRTRWRLPATGQPDRSLILPAHAETGQAGLAFRHGRSLYERNAGHRYIDADPLPMAAEHVSDPDAYAWVEPSRWRHWPDLQGRRVAIIANRELTGLGAEIDAHDEVIRLNRMPFWAHDARHDGVRMTIWAGIAHAHVVPRFSERFYGGALYPSCFPEIAGQLRAIWCVSPFHVSARFLQERHQQDLLDRLLISGGGAFYYDTFLAMLPRDLVRVLYAMPEREDHPMPQWRFDLLLTGVRVTLLCVLAGAREISLFGFDFYADGDKKPWEGHDLAADRMILGAVERHAEMLGCRIRRY